VEKAKRYTIVAGLDFSDPSDLALRKVIEEAERHPECDVHVVSVVDDGGGGLPAATRDSMFAEAAFRTRERLEGTVRDHMEARWQGRGVPPFQTIIHVRIGNPADQVVRLAADVEADLVVVGTHGRRGVQRFLLGSVAERVLRLSHCPVLVVRPKGYAHEEPETPEPPCAECVARRRETGGREWWCVEHARPREQPHAIQLSERFSYPSAWFGA
jgi:nucleotide-binding universal stress UspA family protein